MTAFYKRFEKVPLPTKYFAVLLIASIALCLPFMLLDLFSENGPGVPVWIYLLILDTPFVGALYGFSKEKGSQNYTPSQKYSGMLMAAGVFLVSPILSIGIAYDRPAVGWTVVIPFVMFFIGYKYGDAFSGRLPEKDPKENN